jgi:hypothetical protein
MAINAMAGAGPDCSQEGRGLDYEKRKGIDGRGVKERALMPLD